MSESANTYLRMVGCGRSSVAEVCDISRANVADGMQSKAIYGLNSLGGNGVHDQNPRKGPSPLGQRLAWHESGTLRSYHEPQCSW